MKHSTTAYYNAYSGVYHERRLPKSTQFVVGVYLIIIGLSGLLIGQGMHAHWGRAVTVKVASHNSRLVANTKATPTAPPPAAPIAPAVPITETNAVATAVQAVISKPPAATWSIALYDVKAQNWIYRSNSAAPMASASLYKLYAAYGLSKKVPFSQWATTQIAGKDMKTCVDLMIRVSDNTCGSAIGAYVGWGTIDSLIHAAGFKSTILNYASGPVTTAEDTTRFMVALYQGKLFDADTTAFLKTSLQKQLYRGAIPAGCTGCTVYNKTGNEQGFVHDTAIVVSANRSYAVTIMSQGGNYPKLASVERAIQSALATATP